MTPEQIEYMKSLPDMQYLSNVSIIVGNNGKPLGGYIRREIMKAVADLDAPWLDHMIEQKHRS